MRHYYDLSRLCGLPEIQSYVGTDAYRACVVDVKKICGELFRGQVDPDGDLFEDSPPFRVSETFYELERNYKREVEIFLLRATTPQSDLRGDRETPAQTLIRRGRPLHIGRSFRVVRQGLWR